jgi:hypothetical protein
MNIKLILEYVALCVGVYVLLGFLWLVVFKKPHIKPFIKNGLPLAAVAIGFGTRAANHFYNPQSPYSYWLILLPIVPLIYICFAIACIVSDLDEMKRKIATEAMAFGGLATGVTCYSYMFFRDMGAPALRGDWVLYIMFIYYFIGLFFSWRRYK